MPHVLAQDLRDAVLQAALNGHLSKRLESDRSVNGSDIDIGDTDEYEIKEHWIYVKLNSITNIKNGFTPKRSVPEYWDSKDIPWFTVDDIHNQGHEIKSTIQYISTAALGKSKSRIVKANTVLLCCTSATIGNYAITRIPLTTNQQWNGLEIKEEYNEDVMPEYLLIWVSTLKTKLISEAGQTTFPFLSTKKLGEFLVPLPPIEEQARIVARVDELMAKIDEYEKIEKELVELHKAFPGNMKDAILQAAMQGKLTEQLASDRNVYDLFNTLRECREQELKEKQTKTRFSIAVCDEDDLPEIPNNWMYTKLENLGYFGSGNTPQVEQISKDGTIPYFKVSDMNTEGNELYLKVSNSYLSNTYSGKTFKKGSFVYPKNGGAVFTNKKRILAEDSLVDLNTGVYTPSKVMNYDYMFYIFCTLDFKHLYKGTALPTVDMEKVRNVWFPLPPIEEQQRIVEKLDQLLPLCESLEAMV